MSTRAIPHAVIMTILTPLHYAWDCDGARPHDRDRTPPNGRAILESETVQGMTCGAITDDQSGRRLPSPIDHKDHPD